MKVCAILLLMTNLQILVLSNRNPSVIIIGAGVSGIAAGSKLLENNITDIKILEAQDRIGGRIFTIPLENATLDLGAEWCHAEIGNVEYELVKNYDLLEKTDTSHTFYYSRPKDINRNHVRELEAIFNNIYCLENKSYDVSLNDFMKRKYFEIVTSKYGNNPSKLKFSIEFFDFMERNLLITIGAFSLREIPAKSDYVKLEGNHTLNWKGRGHKTILDVLMNKYPNPENENQIHESLYFNKEVINIEWNRPEEMQKVKVTCSDGSVYFADHVILTVSLGVLKNVKGTLFTPSLPINKVGAIENLGIGGVSKVFLYYINKWWSQNEFENFYLIWNENDQSQVQKEFYYGPTKDGQSWLIDLMGFQSVPKQPNVLMVWFVGEFVPEIEKLSDEIIINGITYILNKFLRQYQNIPQADRVYRHNWYSDPYFRGAYSYQTVWSHKGKMSDEMILSEPLTSSFGKTTLLFAGEATSGIHYGSVHGAIESGFRAADIIANNNNMSGY